MHPTPSHVLVKIRKRKTKGKPFQFISNSCSNIHCCNNRTRLLVSIRVLNLNSLKLIVITGQDLLLLENTAEQGTTRAHQARAMPFEEAAARNGRMKRYPCVRGARPCSLAQSLLQQKVFLRVLPASRIPIATLN